MDDKLKQAVEFHWKNEASPLRVALKDLFELVGYPYPINISWATIREELPRTILDDDALVPRISDIATSFIRRLISTLDADPNNVVDRFIEKTSLANRQIVIKLHPLKDGAIPFTRLTDQCALEFYLPRHRAGFASDALFGDDIEEALLGVSSSDPRSQLGQASTTNLSSHPESGSGITTTLSVPAPTILPQATQLPRPEAIMGKPPLYLRLTESRNDKYEKFELEGYQPCVNLIHEYLTKQNQHRDREFQLWLRPIRWGDNLKKLSVSHVAHEPSASVLVVVALIERELGFQRVGEPLAGMGQVIWLFERKAEFIVL